MLQPNYFMSIEQKKYKRLRKELQFVQSELEYVQEVLSEWHLVFEQYHRDYCKRKEIDLKQLNKQSKKKIKQLIPKPQMKESGVILYDKKDKDVIKKIYKKIARKLHPDLGGDEKEFQEVQEAMQEKNFEKILDVCDKYDILIEIDKEMINFLKEQINEIKEKIKKEKSTYSWKMHLCGGNKLCKNVLVQQFLKQLFNYEGKK